MWPFKKKRFSIIDSGVLHGLTDYHCHILPGVDDGVQTMDEALRTLQKLEKLGICELWLTPHIMEDIPNTPAYLRQRFAEFTTHLSLHLAAEHMLDTLFIQRMACNDLLPYHPSPLFGPGGEGETLILVETSYFHPPMNLYGLLEQIQKKGYTPLLAHPERYMYMSTADYQHLTDMGVLLQLNILSLAGAYGEDAEIKSRKLLHKGAYSCLGTDLHNLDDFLEYAAEECLTEKDLLALHTLQTFIPNLRRDR